jgi:precorrin-6A/cobalt-precorrin-6A reductase
MPHLYPAIDPFNVLVLGGTTEGYALAQALADNPHLHVISSLAGRTTTPRLPPGEVRIGGFGGTDGLAAYLRQHNVGAVIDATHPFAANMGWNAAMGGAKAGVPVLRLERTAWSPGPGDTWIEVDEWEAAASIVGRQARRVLLAVGRQELEAFALIDSAWFLVRSVETPNPLPMFRHAEILLARGPFDLNSERELLTARQIDTIVCKNSGGTATEAKLIAARELGIQVVMKRRPLRPDMPTVASTADAVAWLQSIRS